MGFLDRFKPQPKWKHPDRVIRQSAVESIAESEQELLESIAFEDEDAGVRRAAVGKLARVEALARVAHQDADEGVRVEAREILVAVAQDGTNEAESLAALASLSDPRDVTTVARTAELERVALAATEQVADPRILSVVARQANHAAVRMAALGRLDQTEDLVAVALKTDHRDVGVAALERVPAREHLETLANRARNKAVVRRARALIRSLDERERIEQTEAAAVAHRVTLCEQAEALALVSDFSLVNERLAGLQAQWQLVGDGADAVVSERWNASVSRLQDLLARSEAERAEAQQQAIRLAQEIAQHVESRVAICERVEALDGEEAAAGLNEARTVWIALAPWPDATRQSAHARQVEDRFARAGEACEQRIARQNELAEQRSALDEILVQASQAAAEADPSAARNAWKTVRQTWFAKNGPRLADRRRADAWAELEARMAQRESELREVRSKEAQALLARVTALCDHLEALAHKPDVPLKDADRAMRDARAVIERPGYFPTKQDQERSIERLRAATAALQPRLQEMKESEEWRRWANATIQEELCVKVEGLAQLTDLTEVAKHLRELQQQWKKSGAAPRDRGDELWKRFKAAADAAWARCGEHVAHQREQELANLSQKEHLCGQAEALAESSDWIRTSEELKRLQAEWQAIGGVPREQAKPLWDRFHAACDRFFTRRKADLAERKVVWAENQKKKEAFCARAEVLAESTEWHSALNELKQLQAEWKAVGPVRRQKAEVLWKRFRGSCDRFFERYKQRDQIEAAAHVEARETLCAELEGLTPAATVAAEAGDREHLVEAVMSVWRRWQDAPRVPRGGGDAVEQRFQTALDALFHASGDLFRGTRLDVDANRARREQLCEQVEHMVAGKVTPRELAAAPAAALATMLKDALASNTIGGKVDDETRQRTAVVAVREAQNGWRRLGPVPGETGRDLEQRFRKAVRRFSELRQNQQPVRTSV
ncbi:MAG: DUF349 domain-containing protein [Vicinamibacterales bacterium]